MKTPPLSVSVVCLVLETMAFDKLLLLFHLCEGSEQYYEHT